MLSFAFRISVLAKIPDSIWDSKRVVQESCIARPLFSILICGGGKNSLVATSNSKFLFRPPPLTGGG